jgi:hypothetical protein
MAFETKAFGLFYKHFPSTSLQPSAPYNAPLLSENAFDVYYLLQTDPWTSNDIRWYTSGSNNTATNDADTFESWFNYPRDRGVLSGSQWRSTRTTDSMTGSYRALPWGSHACDFMWNVLVPSWSSPIGTVGGDDAGIGNWFVTYSSRSFHYDSGSTKFGVQNYNITSSWHVYDPKMIPDSSGSVWPANSRPNFIIRRIDASGAMYTQYTTPPADVILVSPYTSSNTDAAKYPIPTPGHYYTSCSYQLGSNITRETSSVDGQYFDRGGGAAITRTEVSRSLVTASLFGSSTDSTGLRNFRRGLKNRRLFFPTPYSGSGTPLGTDYWLKSFTGFQANELFTENGGIYSVDFTLKRYVPHDRYPDAGSYMSVFIHNVIDNAPVPSARVAGADGWYPPANNIVTIGNGYGSAPLFTFFDPTTGFYHERFSVMLIQYGAPAQLCFEASGSLATNSYFGVIIDDISFCKLGVTTDPSFTKPGTNGGFVIPSLPGGLSPREDLEVS